MLWFGKMLIQYQMTKIFARSKLKAFGDDQIHVNVDQMAEYVLDRVENIVGKGGNIGYQHFFLFPQCFQKVSFSGSLKSGSVW